MRSNRLRHAIKLNEDDALIKPIFIDARRQATRQETAARGLKRRASELGVRSESVLIMYRAVRRNPICFSHSFDKCPFERQPYWRGVALNATRQN
jgi:hypothetical protein